MAEARREVPIIESFQAIEASLKQIEAWIVGIIKLTHPTDKAIEVSSRNDFEKNYLIQQPNFLKNF